MSKSELVLFPIPILAIKGAVCFSCLKPAEKLNRCKGCKRVWYCSSDCQKKDWKKAHKNVCPALAEWINPLDAPCEPRTWEDYRGDIWMRIDIFRNLPKSLLMNDERILQYQPHCATCHRNTFQLPPTSNSLTICPTCRLAHHCASCPTTTHTTRYCNTLLTIATDEQFAINHYLETSRPSLQVPTDTPRTTYLPLSTAKSWYDYFTLISDKSMLRDFLSPDLQPLVGNDEMACAFRAATNKSSMILTILAALEVIFGPALATQEKLTLHLIGATATELDVLMLFEELLHLLPTLKDVHCVFVGLEMPRPMLNADDSASDGKIDLDCCAACTAAGRKRSMSMHKTSYHSFSSLPSYSAPDLAVAFHTGHSQEAIASWSPTIRLLSHAKFPTVFTTYNRKEMEEETVILAGLGARFLVQGEKNRWRAMRMLLEVAEEEENGVYCNNYYWYVIAGSDGRK